MPRRAAVLMLCLGILTPGLFASPAAARAIVVMASGKSVAFRAGQLLPDNETVLLAAGQRLTVLDGQGTRMLSGPGRYAVHAPPPAEQTQIADLVRTAMGRRPVVGGLRGRIARAPHPADLWVLDIDRGGTLCLPPGLFPRLTRSEMSAERRMTLTGRDGSAELLFGAGQGSLDWPATVRLLPESRFELTGPATPPVAVDVRAVPQPASLLDFARALGRAGCMRQLAMLDEDRAP